MPLSQLIGACLLHCQEVTQDSAELVFDRGRLQILNPFELNCDSGERVTAEAIIGCAVSMVFITGTELHIVFESRVSLKVSLREEDFIGAAAVRYVPTDGVAVVVP